MYAQGPGAMMGGQSPAELAQQQERWEKERIDNAKSAYQGQIVHLALSLMNGPHGASYDHKSALRTAHELMQSAKTYNP